MLSQEWATYSHIDIKESKIKEYRWVSRFPWLNLIYYINKKRYCLIVDGIESRYMSQQRHIELQAGLVSIGKIDFEKLSIPPYQRPYRWTTENVGQLLADIKANSGKEEYRIGSLILHHDEKDGTLNLVDGQQRIISIVLILKSLGIIVPFNAEFQSSVSKTHIRENFAYIENWLTVNIGHAERNLFLDFILSKCKFIWVQTNQIYEAFLMFDSQNGHGKELLPYNLLKAYHIHAFDICNDSIQITDEKKCTTKDGRILRNMRLMDGLWICWL